MRQLKAFNAKNTYDTLFFLAGFPTEMNCLRAAGKQQITSPNIFHGPYSKWKLMIYETLDAKKIHERNILKLKYI